MAYSKRQWLSYMSSPWQPCRCCSYYHVVVSLLLLALLLVTIILEPLLQLPPQAPLVQHSTPAMLQRLPPRPINGIKADHALAFFVVKQVVVCGGVVGQGGLLGAAPGRRGEEAAQGVGEVGAPGGGGEGGWRGEGEVVGVAGAVAADEGEDGEGEEEIEGEGEGEGEQEGLFVNGE